MELTIEELTKLKIEKHFKNMNNKKYYKVTIEDLINLSIKVVKVMEREL